MPSDEYLRDLETSAHLDRIARKQEQEIMICPVCGRKIDKWVWRTTCCGAEIVWEEKKEGGEKMSKEEALRRLRDFMLVYGFNGELLEAYGMALDALENQPEWISVSERLPEGKQEILISLSWDNDIPEVRQGNIDDINYWKHYDHITSIAWMPLPEPYKAEGSEE